MSEDWVNDENCLGHLVGYGVQHGLCPSEYVATTTMKSLRQLWPKIDPYFQRQIICSIEVALLRVDVKPVALADEWQALRDELRGPKAPFTVNYRCGKCGQGDLKLWRGVHGCKNKDGHELLCAGCLAPGVLVGDDGRAESDPCRDAGGRAISMGGSDQIAGWLPAVPVDDTYWGYSSVPSQDVDWWKALPTYPTSERRGGAP